MAAISLFWDTNMAVVTSFENTLTIRRIQRELLQHLEKVSSSMCPSLSIIFLCPKYLFSPVQATKCKTQCLFKDEIAIEQFVMLQYFFLDSSW